jgi:hypothetical protein
MEDASVTRIRRWYDIFSIDDGSRPARFWAATQAMKDKVADARVIRQDVARTRGDETFFKHAPIRRLMHECLLDFCAFHKLEYMQGLNEVLAPLLAINIVSTPGQYSLVNSHKATSKMIKTKHGDIYTKNINESLENNDSDEMASPHISRAMSESWDDMDDQIDISHLKIQYNSSFVFFEKLVHSLHSCLFSTHGMEALQAQLACFHNLLFYMDAELAMYLFKQGMRSDLYAQSWLITLFARRTEVEIALYIYDFFLQYHQCPCIIIIFAVAFLVGQRDMLLSAVMREELPEIMSKMTFTSAAQVDEAKKLALCIFNVLPPSVIKSMNLLGFDMHLTRDLRKDHLRDLLYRPCVMVSARDFAVSVEFNKSELLRASLDSNDGSEESGEQGDDELDIEGADVDEMHDAEEIGEAIIVSVPTVPAFHEKKNDNNDTHAVLSNENTLRERTISGSSLSDGVAMLNDFFVKSSSSTQDVLNSMGNSVGSVLATAGSNSTLSEMVSSSALGISSMAINATSNTINADGNNNSSQTLLSLGRAPVDHIKSIYDLPDQVQGYVLLDCRHPSEVTISIQGAVPVSPQIVDEFCTASEEKIALEVEESKNPNGLGNFAANSMADFKFNRTRTKIYSEAAADLYDLLVECYTMGMHFILFDTGNERPGNFTTHVPGMSGPSRRKANGNNNFSSTLSLSNALSFPGGSTSISDTDYSTLLSDGVKSSGDSIVGLLDSLSSHGALAMSLSKSFAIPTNSSGNTGANGSSAASSPKKQKDTPLTPPKSPPRSTENADGHSNSNSTKDNKAVETKHDRSSLMMATCLLVLGFSRVSVIQGVDADLLLEDIDPSYTEYEDFLDTDSGGDDEEDALQLDDIVHRMRQDAFPDERSRNACIPENAYAYKYDGYYTLMFHLLKKDHCINAEIVKMVENNGHSIGIGEEGGGGSSYSSPNSRNGHTSNSKASWLKAISLIPVPEYQIQFPQHSHSYKLIRNYLRTLEVLQEQLRSTSKAEAKSWSFFELPGMSSLLNTIDKYGITPRGPTTTTGSDSGIDNETSAISTPSSRGGSRGFPAVGESTPTPGGVKLTSPIPGLDPLNNPDHAERIDQLVAQSISKIRRRNNIDLYREQYDDHMQRFEVVQQNLAFIEDFKRQLNDEVVLLREKKRQDAEKGIRNKNLTYYKTYGELQAYGVTEAAGDANKDDNEHGNDDGSVVKEAEDDLEDIL